MVFALPVMAGKTQETEMTTKTDDPLAGVEAVAFACAFRKSCAIMDVRLNCEKQSHMEKSICEHDDNEMDNPAKHDHINLLPEPAVRKAIAKILKEKIIQPHNEYVEDAEAGYTPPYMEVVEWAIDLADRLERVSERGGGGE